MARHKLKYAHEDFNAAKIREAIGVGPTDEVEVITPQFERTADQPKPSPPPDFGQINKIGCIALKEMGCAPWDVPDENGNVLMLFPGEWYGSIPAGFNITDICGETEPFIPGETDDDIRFGCLAFGIIVPAGS